MDEVNAILRRADPDRLIGEALGLGMLCAAILAVFALPAVA